MCPRNVDEQVVAHILHGCACSMWMQALRCCVAASGSAGVLATSDASFARTPSPCRLQIKRAGLVVLGRFKSRPTSQVAVL